MSVLGIMAGAAAGLGVGAINNIWAQNQQRESREENYLFGEMAAENTDRRTRALYNDLYSPEAQLRQIKAAGISPSVYFGGTPGQGGTSGAQGTGAAGLGTPYMPMSLMEGAQIAAIEAQTQKTKAETENIKEDTILKGLAEDWQAMLNQQKNIEFELTTMAIDDNGKQTSLYEIANNCRTYEDFIKKARELAEYAPGGNLIIRQMGTEAGQKTMRDIYMAANRFERDVKVLSEEGVSADFQKKLMQCLNKEGFAEQNAHTAISQLQAAAEAADLTREQKSAFNNIIERLRKTSSTTADIIIVASMILNQAASHWGGSVTALKK